MFRFKIIFKNLKFGVLKPNAFIILFVFDPAVNKAGRDPHQSDYI